MAAPEKEDASKPETYRGEKVVSYAHPDTDNPTFEPLSVSEVAILLDVRREQLERVCHQSHPSDHFRTGQQENL
jgi:hypothetical protein